MLNFRDLFWISNVSFLCLNALRIIEESKLHTGVTPRFCKFSIYFHSSLRVFLFPLKTISIALTMSIL